MKFHRTTRLVNYDYRSPGAYFITIVVAGRDCCLSNIVDNRAILTEQGKIVVIGWQWLGEQYPYVKPDDLVVMPNHLHGLLWIVDEEEITEQAARQSNRLPVPRIVASFKARTTREINKLRNTAGKDFWQPDFIEHVCRDEYDLAVKRKYIADNPYRWDKDDENLHRIS